RVSARDGAVNGCRSTPWVSFFFQAEDGIRDFHVTGVQTCALPISGSVDGGGLELDFGGDGGPRTLRIAASPVPADEAQAARWRREDLAHGLPRLAPGQAEQWTPQQLSLERLRAFSVHTGCYPGQEIGGRTRFLGQA